MSEAAAVFARSLVIGVFVAAPVGAIGCLVIARTLASGWRRGLATGAGVATADCLYASVAAFGLTAVTGALMGAAGWLQVAGGIALVVLGVRAAMSAPVACVADAPQAGHTRAYASAVALTLANPMTIMAFAAVFASAGLASVADDGWTAAAAATLGVALGSFAWWFGLVTATWFARSRASDRALGLVSRVSGIAVAAFGAVAVVTALL